MNVEEAFAEVVTMIVVLADEALQGNKTKHDEERTISNFRSYFNVMDRGEA